MSLRISAPANEDDGRVRRGPGEAADAGGDAYLSRLVKLIPGEAVVAYPFLHSRAEQVIGEFKGLPHGETKIHVWDQGGVGADALGTSYYATGPDHWLLIAMAWLILALVVLLRWQATRGPGGPQWGAVIIAAVSFMLWVPVMNGSFGIMDLYSSLSGIAVPDPIERFIPELLLVLWTILIPAFYRPS
ncbi:MAG: hypothetical protein NW216_03115 [Hyphomicrobium sp.]|nr:hypothetical protein [Hyphomicrobium sp.]